MTRRGVFLFLTTATIGLGIVTFAQKSSVPKQSSKDSLAQQNVTELLLLMDTDKNGKVSKQEWMKFMEAEFTSWTKTRRQDGRIRPKRATAIHSIGQAYSSFGRRQVTGTGSEFLSRFKGEYFRFVGGVECRYSTQ